MIESAFSNSFPFFSLPIAEMEQKEKKE